MYLGLVMLFEKGYLKQIPKIYPNLHDKNLIIFEKSYEGKEIMNSYLIDIAKLLGKYININLHSLLIR